jgi:mono/diheme cytochrome c family protein
VRRLVAGSFLVAALLWASGAQAQDDAVAKRGKMLWTNRGCAGCHGFGRKMAGPDLMGVQQRRPREWLVRWLRETDVMQGSDSVSIAMVAEWMGI